MTTPAMPDPTDPNQCDVCGALPATLQAQPAQPAAVSDATINRVVYEHTKLNPNQADDLDLLLGIRSAVRAILALRPQPTSDEPFGYFRAHPFGWEQCAEADEGAVALYERPQVGDINVVESVTSAAQQAYPLPDDLYDSKDWRQGNYASRVEWLHTMYETAKATLDLYLAQQAVPMTEQWRLLNTGEQIEAGDECLEDDCVTWGQLAGWEVGQAYNPMLMVPLRRRAPSITAHGAGEVQG